MEKLNDPHTSLALSSVQPGFGLVVDAGPQRRKHIKRLKRGSGRLAAQVEAAVGEAQAKFGIDPEAEIIPVVLLYRSIDTDIDVPPSQT